jgi:hypothetical protein
MYLFRAADNRGQRVTSFCPKPEIVKQLRAAPTNSDNRPPDRPSIDGSRSYPAAIRELKAEGQSDQLVVTAVDGMQTIVLNLIIGTWIYGSAQEFVKSGILRDLPDFLKSDVFGVGDGHALCFQ